MFNLFKSNYWFLHNRSPKYVTCDGQAENFCVLLFVAFLSQHPDPADKERRNIGKRNIKYVSPKITMTKNNL